MKWPWSRSRPDSKPAVELEPSAQVRLVKVGYARNLPEAEMLQGLLRGEGIESMVRRSGGADVPDYLAAGGRDVLVSERDAQRARELLA